MKNLHALPHVEDSWSYLYVERARIEQDDKAVAAFDADGKLPIPCASLLVLMLGPGTSVTHAAVRTLVEAGCLIVWTGEAGVRCYAQGLGETRSSRRLERQASCWADPKVHLQVVRRLYEMRFDEPLARDLTLEQIRGREGVRVREAYARASRETGVEWTGRSYRRQDWSSASPINRALSVANSCLYGVCHAAILSAGYSPGLGFIHVGKMLSFVYDVADLYKTETTIPAAFQAITEAPAGAEALVRHRMRDRFAETQLLGRIVCDLGRLFQQDGDGDDAFADDEAAPGELWSPEGGVAGGQNWAPATAGEE